MINLEQLQKDILNNKISKGFNTTDINLEFSLTYEELGEAFRAYRKKLPDLGEELADVAIYLLSLSEILHINLGEEILKKVEKNKKRAYKKIDGVMTRIKEA